MKKLIFPAVIFVLVVFSFEVLVKKFDVPKNTYHNTFRNTLQLSKSNVKEKLFYSTFQNCIIYCANINLNPASTTGNYFGIPGTERYIQCTKKVLRI